MTFEAIVEEIETLSIDQRKALIMALVDSLARNEKPPNKTHSLLELEGLGAEIWEGIDAQEYVNQLRSEWDHRP
jgi:hypothetical protein